MFGNGKLGTCDCSGQDSAPARSAPTGTNIPSACESSLVLLSSATDHIDRSLKIVQNAEDGTHFDGVRKGRVKEEGKPPLSKGGDREANGWETSSAIRSS